MQALAVIIIKHTTWDIYHAINDFRHGKKMETIYVTFMGKTLQNEHFGADYNQTHNVCKKSQR